MLSIIKVDLVNIMTILIIFNF